MSELIKGAGKSKLRLYFTTALMLALAITGGLFAYAYTTRTTALSVTDAKSDFASVTVNNTVGSYSIFGSYRGRIPQGNLFAVTPAANYPGDLEVSVYLDNIDQLSYKYGLLLMRIRFVDSGNSTVDVDGIQKPLSLNNGVVTFTASTLLAANTTYYIQTTGGVYRTFPWAYIGTSGGTYAPSITADVLQAGL